MVSKKCILDVFLGCCSSAFLMEILMVNLSQTATLITFLQYLTVSISGFVTTAKFGTVRPVIPLREYALLVVLFFITTVANNYVYALHVPSTLHMIIRSASLPASVIVTWYAKKKSPKLTTAIGSILVSFGVSLAMYGGSTLVDRTSGKFLHWSIGVGILLATLFTGAHTGLLQEKLFEKYGRHPEEMMFYTRLLPLPFFLTLYPSMKTAAFEVHLNGWYLILANLLAQFYCAHAAHQLAAKETAVTVNLILTLRKFLSLLISAMVFKSDFTVLHAIGTVFVATGTFIYFDCFKSNNVLSKNVDKKGKVE